MAKRLTAKQAIKQFCRFCNGETLTGGRHYDCLDHNCVLYPFKEGKGNYEIEALQQVTQEHKDYLKKHGTGVQKSRELSVEDKQKVTERLRKARENKQANKEEVNE